MKKYYAAYIICPDEIAIFNTFDECNLWVHHQDAFSKAVGMCGVDRVALSYDKAYQLIGDRLNDESCYDEDMELDNVMWVAGANHDNTLQSYLNGTSPTVYDLLGVKF